MAGRAAADETEAASAGPVAGSLDLHTNGGRVGITSGTSPLSPVEALVHVVNNDSVTCSLRATAYWSGSAEAPYQNNDTYLSEAFNDVASDSLNRSWAGSFANAYNNIPAGVTDSGTRVGAIGWAVSVDHEGFRHEGTLFSQIGIHGTAGFQGAGSPSTAVIANAVGVRGYIWNDSDGATIETAKAGEFVSAATPGVVQRNFALYASAAEGTVENYSFYGNAGDFYNADQVLVGNQETQSSSSICARNAGNAYEFGHPDPKGYASNIDGTQLSGEPFVAFCAEADPTGDTFATRGKLGAVIGSDLAGALVFSRLTDANASGQTPTESARFDADGHLVLSSTPCLASNSPSSSTATGKTGEVCWDQDFIYVCVAANTWKRATLWSW